MEALERYERELRIRNYSPRTVRSYLTCVRAFFAFHRSTSAVSGEDVRRFLDHLQRSGVSPQTLNVHLQAIKMFAASVLHAPLGVEVHYAKRRISSKTVWMCVPKDGRLDTARRLCREVGLNGIDNGVSDMIHYCHSYEKQEKSLSTAGITVAFQ